MLLKKAVIFLCFIFLLILFQKPAYAATLLSTGFEDGTIGSWSSSGGSATATVSGEVVRSGSYSIKVQHDKTASYGYQYTISNIEGGMFYQVSGYGKTTNSNTASFFIRLAWYSSTDGSGSQLSSPNDSNAGSSSDADWVLLNQTVQAPATANSAKVRLVLTSKTSGQTASAYFDDIVFQESIAPTPTPTDTPTPTNTPSPTLTPTSTKTPTPSPTKSPTPTPSLTISISPTEADPTSVLGESSPIDEPAKVVQAKEAKVLGSKQGGLGKILITIGLIFLVISGILAFRTYAKSRKEKQD